jgi:hypothetical protein
VERCRRGRRRRSFAARGQRSRETLVSPGLRGRVDRGRTLPGAAAQ